MNKQHMTWLGNSQVARNEFSSGNVCSSLRKISEYNTASSM